MAYHGVKFKTEFVRFDLFDYSGIDELISWCNIFAKRELAPTHPEGSYGNLSVRVGDAMLITATSLDLGASLTKSDFVLVHECDYQHYTIKASGEKSPSSESPVHWALYKKRPEVQAVFHGHDESILKWADTLNLAVTAREQEYGSLALVEEVTALYEHDFIIMRNHGFLSLGKTMTEAGELALGQLDRIG